MPIRYTRLNLCIAAGITAIAGAAAAIAGPGQIGMPVGPGVPVSIGTTCEISDTIPSNPPMTTCGVRMDPRFSFASDGPGTQYGIKVTAPPAHCSPVNYQIYATYDLNLLLGRTANFLNGGQSEIIPIGNSFARGEQVVAIRALGKVAGCNQGRMQSWGAILELVVIP